VRFRKEYAVKSSTIVIDHAGQELVWDVKILERSNKKPQRGKVDDDEVERLPFDPFDHINQYLNQLPPHKQNELFEEYRAIREILEPYAHESIKDLRRRVPPHIKKIFEICPPEHVAQWVRLTPTIVFPSGIRVYPTYEESAEKGEGFGLRNRPADATYIEKDYWGLVVLVMLTRMLVPIWGQFLENVNEEVNNQFKEMYALRLATQTVLAETDGYTRLETYINRYLTPEKFKNSAMEGSVPREDAPFQTLAILIVRRLAWVDFSGRDPNFSLIGRVYSFIEQHLEGADRQFNERVKPKIPESGAGGNDQENRASVSELIKIREPFPAGDLTLPEACARTPELFIGRMHPDMDETWLQLALKTIEPLRRNRPLQSQFTILQNVLGAECRQLDGQWEVDPKFQERWDALFPPRAIDEMNLVEDLNMMAVGTALLCYNGFYDIAALMTATPDKDREGNPRGSSPPPAELTDANLAALAEHFPYHQRKEGKRRSDNPSYAKQPNVAVRLINNITQDIAKYQWLLNLPPAWVKRVPNHDGNRRYIVKSDFRNRFAELATRIATRSF
jgi:hypothetical protein